MSRHFNLPRGKRIVLYRSGDKFYSGAPFTINPRYIKSVNDLLAEATDKVDAVWGAVRSIHTPNTGTKISTLEAINPQGAYVAAGVKGFINIPGGYENIGRPVLIRKRRTGPSRNASRRSYYGQDVFKGFKVAVYRNGENTTTYPFTFTTDDYEDWEKALDRLSKHVPNGPIRRFFYLSGNNVQSPQDLINYGTYVVAGEGEDFHKTEYVDVALGVEDDGSGSSFRDSGSRWSEASPETEDSGGRLSKNHGFPSFSFSQGSEREETENEEEERWNEREEEEGNEYEYEDEAEYSYYENYKDIEEEEVEEEERREREREWPRGRGEKEAEDEDAGGGGGGSWRRREEYLDEGSEVMILGDRTSSQQASPEVAVYTSLTPSSSSSSSFLRRKAHWRGFVMPPQIPEGGHSQVDYLDLENDSLSYSSFSSSTDDDDLRVYRDSTFPMHTPIEEETEGELEEGEDGEEGMEEGEEEDWRRGEGMRSRSRLSIFDSGHASLLSDEDRPDSVFRAKRLSRPATRAMEVDYDTDDGGVYKAKHRSDYAAQEVLESSATNIEMPVDLVDATEVQEEIYAS